MGKGTKNKGRKIDWAEFCEEANSGPKFGRSSRSSLPSGPSGLPTGPGGSGGGGGYGRDGDRGRRGGGFERPDADPNAGRSDGPGQWRRGGGGGGGGGSGGGFGSSFGRSRDDRGGGGDRDRDEERPGPSRAEESTSWRSARAAPSRAAPSRSKPSFRDREPPKRSFNDAPVRRDRSPPRRERSPVRDRSPPGRGMFGSRQQPARSSAPARSSFRDGPVRRDGPSMARGGSPPRRRSPPRAPAPRRDFNDEDLGSFRNRAGPARRPMGNMNLNRNDGPHDGPANTVAPMDRRGANPMNFEVDAAGAFKREQKATQRRNEARDMGCVPGYDEFGDPLGEDSRPRRSGLKEGTAKIKAAPINAWGARGNPVTGTPQAQAPRRPTRPTGNAAPIGRVEPARAPPNGPGGFVQRMPQTRFAGTPSGFAFDLVQKLMREGPPGRGRGRGRPRQVSNRFQRPEQRIQGGMPGPLPAGPARRGLPSGPGARAATVPSGPGPRARQAPQAPPPQSDQSAFPELPEAPKRKITKVPVDTRRLQREAEAERKRQEKARRQEEREAAEKKAREDLAKSKKFVEALGHVDLLQADIFTAGLTVILNNPNINLATERYGKMCLTLNMKCPSVISNPDLHKDNVSELLAKGLGQTIQKSSADKPAVEPFEILQHFLGKEPKLLASIAEGAFKYILERSKGDESRLVALTEGINVMELLNAPEDKDDWDDFLEDMGLFCLAPEEDVADQVAQAIEDGEEPKEVLAILANTEAVPPSVAKQVATYLADGYNKAETVASEFVDDSVTALFKKAAGSSERTQIGAINAVTDRWYSNGKRKSALVLLIKELFEKEALPVAALLEWKERRGNKAKQAALLDSFEKKLIGGVEHINMSDYLDSIDPAKQRKNQQEEEESESEEEAVHNSYLGGDVLTAGMGQSELPEECYGEWSD